MKGDGILQNAARWIREQYKIIVTPSNSSVIDFYVPMSFEHNLVKQANNEIFEEQTNNEINSPVYWNKAKELEEKLNIEIIPDISTRNNDSPDFYDVSRKGELIGKVSPIGIELIDSIDRKIFSSDKKEMLAQTSSELYEGSTIMFYSKKEAS